MKMAEPQSVWVLNDCMDQNPQPPLKKNKNFSAYLHDQN